MLCIEVNTMDIDGLKRNAQKFVSAVFKPYHPRCIMKQLLAPKISELWKPRI